MERKRKTFLGFGLVQLLGDFISAVGVVTVHHCDTDGPRRTF